MFKRLRGYFTGRWRFTKSWLRQAKPFWLWLAGFVALIILPFLLSEGEARFRWAGMVLQFAGIGTVVSGLGETRKLFKRPSIWTAVRAWLSQARYIIIPPPSVAGTMNVTLPAMGAIATGVAGVALVAKGNLEARVSALEAGQKQLEEGLANLAAESTRRQQRTEQLISQESSERKCGDENISQQLEEVAIGGIHLEMAGLAYLYFGIAFTSIPSELAWALEQALHLIGL